LALAAGKRIAAKRKCAVVSGGNLDAGVLASLLQDVRPRPPRKPRQRKQERLMPPAALPSALPAGLLSSLSHTLPTPRKPRVSRTEELPA
ncbi:MAG TPA: threonine/serine dehydratase, partial [Thermomonas sp.]|nr:threonine/serine dehydratase [Thermomonas sp.]